MRNYKNYNISPHKNSHHKCKLYINHKHRNSRVKPLNQCKSISNYFHEQFKNKNLGARKTFRLILIMSLSKVNCMQKKKLNFKRLEMTRQLKIARVKIIIYAIKIIWWRYWLRLFIRISASRYTPHHKPTNTSIKHLLTNNRH